MRAPEDASKERWPGESESVRVCSHNLVHRVEDLT